jgi:hypothetical protein
MTSYLHSTLFHSPSHNHFYFALSKWCVSYRLHYSMCVLLLFTTLYIVCVFGELLRDIFGWTCRVRWKGECTICLLGLFLVNLENQPYRQIVITESSTSWVVYVCSFSRIESQIPKETPQSVLRHTPLSRVSFLGDNFGYFRRSGTKV